MVPSPSFSPIISRRRAGGNGAHPFFYMKWICRGAGMPLSGKMDFNRDRMTELFCRARTDLRGFQIRISLVLYSRTAGAA